MNKKIIENKGKEFSLNAQVGEDGEEWQDWLADKELDHDLKSNSLIKKKWNKEKIYLKILLVF